MLPSIGTLVEKVLVRAKVPKESLSGVEVVGGGWRVPRVQQEIEKIIKVNIYIFKLI